MIASAFIEACGKEIEISTRFPAVPTRSHPWSQVFSGRKIFNLDRILF